MVKIKDLANSERPREKLISKGPQNLNLSLGKKTFSNKIKEVE